MLEIDGSAGGGQLLRTALTLSVLDDRPFRIEDVRAERPNPGLRSQHLACVRAAARLADADVDGDEVGADTLAFRPDGLAATDVGVDVGTAGSVTLVFDTLLPVAVALSRPVSVTVTGGTDVKGAPPLDYYRRVKLPLLARFGLDADVTCARRGFYPAGGGEATLSLAPASLSRFDLTTRGDFDGVTAHSVASEALEKREVADRQASRAVALLDDAGIETESTVDYVSSDSPGSVLVLRATCGRTLAGFDALGERGRSSEEVAEGAVSALLSWRDGPGAVDSHLADQLLVPLALAGGRVRVPSVTPHVETNAAVIRAFGYDVAIETDGDGALVSA
ncbi:RNA 3'-terminal phosphate cyclase [Salinirarus marinus]|uniref:RNA 3'-terminal phosphate cyclase n=1 Tax=Salinirarus marinus TaxID=3068310 RepID=UPI003C6C94FE